ncbi:MAG: tRNA (N(6)-L-threonylcarbamoyladenosine(37)-C(2))-methylthiotransferase MtaB [Ruminococcaceae bacterium]|nr:tRNA (N(6)-L-threonylcarbamoyladenosine(37)-C(2))-methylthiotransferase MtaB [Oscillospiraceae bacterium]
MTKKTVALATLGCKVNQYESEAIAEALEGTGWEILSPAQPCDAYIVNTCTVTAESDRKARQTIRRMMKQNPFAYILVTGCYSQVSPDAISAISGVDYICGSSNKMSVVEKLNHLYNIGQKNTQTEICVPNLDSAEFENMSITKFDRTRAYVKIEDGCESHCAYCTIPAARGPIRSKPASEVISEVEGLVHGGCREVVLTGIETGSYGKDISKETDLASILEQIDTIPNIGRVRLGSLDPSMIKPDFVNRIKKLRSITPHFHLSMQSGSSAVLAGMKRKYNADQAMRAVKLLRDAFPTLQLTTDIIVGFPGETEQDFEQSCALVENARFLMVHVFPYSKRQGTPAATMKNQVADDIKHLRVKALSQKAADIRGEILDSLMGGEVDVLFESANGGYAYGHTPEFVEVKVKSNCNMHAKICRVRLLSHDGNVCEGELI